MNLKKIFIITLFFIYKISTAQEVLPVYSDYLSDNYYLLHPSMAGAANCAKLRLTARQQWFGQKDAPALQTASFNMTVGEHEGVGIILFNDKNGYHSQKGAKITYAHHLMFSRDEVDLNQLSFGVNVGFSQSELDETDFKTNFPAFDPAVIGGIVQSASYFNIDLGLSYNLLDFYAHLTLKNVLGSERKIYTIFEPVDLKRLVFNTGYTFGEDPGLLIEPSIMFQYVNSTKEKTFDFNLKVYKTMDFGKLWGGVSYRRSLDGAQYLNGAFVETQKLQYITPIIGANYKQFMFAYTYSYLNTNLNFAGGGFHQITLGANLFCKREKYHCNCPAVN
jgi:type IX secretion system PorP/SprF family membrane protein